MQGNASYYWKCVASAPRALELGRRAGGGTPGLVRGAVVLEAKQEVIVEGEGRVALSWSWQCARACEARFAV